MKVIKKSILMSTNKIRKIIFNKIQNKRIMIIISKNFKMILF